MKSNHKGFSVVEVLVIVVIVGLVGAVGWLVYDRQNNKTADSSAKSTQVADTKQIELKDTSETFAVRYPSNWSVVPYETPGHDGPVSPAPDWSKDPQPITLRNKNNKNAEIRIDGYTNVSTTIDKEIEAINNDQFNTYSKVTINGYEGIKHVLDFVGPSSAEKYKDTTYIVLDKSSKVTLTFRERYSNVTTSGKYDFDATNLSAEFEKVVNSIKFLD
jgi:type II secretory pathway pseudopilin PulG